MWIQKQIQLSARARGFHLVTNDILENFPEIKKIRIGVMHIFIKHTSASLTVNENADPSVRKDFEAFFNHSVPENEAYYTHVYEGSDDLPAHIKSSILGSSVLLPITDGGLNIGTWQGVYLCEHRNNGGPRTLVITVNAEKF